MRSVILIVVPTSLMFENPSESDPGKLVAMTALTMQAIPLIKAIKKTSRTFFILIV